METAAEKRWPRKGASVHYDFQIGFVGFFPSSFSMTKERPMDLPSVFRPMVANPGFWTRYFFDDWYCSGPDDVAAADEPEEPDFVSPGETWDAPIEFQLSAGYALELRVSDDLFCTTLALKSGCRSKPKQIAWDDTVHFHPHVLRWDELELVCRLAALADSTLPHPGVPLLLLARFAPIVEGDADVAFAMTESAWQSVNCPLTWLDVRTRQFDRRGKGFEWHFEEPFGWTLFQSEEACNLSGSRLYTLRSPQSKEFPARKWQSAFAAALEQYRAAVDPEWMTRNGGKAAALARKLAGKFDKSKAIALSTALEAAGCRHTTILEGLRSGIPVRACWIVELLADSEIGALIRKHFGPTKFLFRPETRLVLYFREPLKRLKAGRPSLSTDIAERLNGFLRRADIGKAKEGIGLGGYKDDVLVDATGAVDITLFGELEEGLPLLRKTLARCDLPPKQRLIVWERTGPRKIPVVITAKNRRS